MLMPTGAGSDVLCVIMTDLGVTGMLFFEQYEFTKVSNTVELTADVPSVVEPFTFTCFIKHSSLFGIYKVHQNRAFLKAFCGPPKEIQQDISAGLKMLSFEIKLFYSVCMLTMKTRDLNIITIFTYLF